MPKKDEQKPEPEETVAVPKAQLDEFLARMSQLEKDNATLMAVADKGRLASFLSKQELPHAMFVQLRTLPTAEGNKVVIAWKPTKDLVWKENGVWKEDQRTMVFLEDGTSQEMPLIDFWSSTSERMKAEVTKQEKSFESGKEVVMLTLACEDGKERHIDQTFVN